MFENKYELSGDEALFLAKKTLVENIYSQAKMENINITFPDTKTIIDGMSVSGLNTDDIQKVLNLRNAWRFVLDDISATLDLEYIKTVHSIVAFGELPPSMIHTLRTGAVSIGGSFYQPAVITENDANKRLKSILNNQLSTTEKALDYFLYACHAQLFWDGNKRTATLITNKIMISAGVGVFIIEEKNLRRFNKLMIDFYETADKSRIKPFLYNNCIFGIDYEH